ncbi:MAG: hypothetical protein ACKOCX_05990 [Planctomycetota bacterium]
MTDRNAPPPAPTTDTRGSDPDRAVDEEWQAIEAARIAEERAEAAADLVEGAQEPVSRRRWPWLALAGALAAGLVVTRILNRPGARPPQAAGQPEPGGKP